MGRRVNPAAVIPGTEPSHRRGSWLLSTIVATVAAESIAKQRLHVSEGFPARSQVLP